MATTIRLILLYVGIALGHFFLTMGALLGGVIICNLEGTGTPICLLSEKIAALLRLPIELMMYRGLRDPQYPAMLLLNSLFWSAVLLAIILKIHERRARYPSRAN